MLQKYDDRKEKKKDILRSSDLTPVAEDSDRMH